MRGARRWQLERQLFSLYREAGELDFPSEEWVFEVLPDGNGLQLQEIGEGETVESLRAATGAESMLEGVVLPAVVRATMSGALRVEAERGGRARSITT